MTLWQQILIIIAGSAALAAALIPCVMPLLRRYALARPNARSSHKQPTPQGGGAVIVLVVMLVFFGLGFLQFEGWITGVMSYYSTLLIAAGVMALIGAVDDIRPLPAVVRLILQTLLVTWVVATAPADWRLVPEVPMLLERAFCIFAGVWFVNLVNFMDGVDLMTVAEGVPVGAALAFAACVGLLSLNGGIVAAALCGGLIGFALYNRHPAKLFLGDVGSLPIGLMLAALLFELAARTSIVAALLLPMYFLVDATGTVVLRWRAGENLFEAHRRHAYQNAVDGGWGVSRVIVWVLGLNLVLVMLACVATLASLLEIRWLLGLTLAQGIATTLYVSRRFRAALR